MSPTLVSGVFTVRCTVIALYCRHAASPRAVLPSTYLLLFCDFFQRSESALDQILSYINSQLLKLFSVFTIFILLFIKNEEIKSSGLMPYPYLGMLSSSSLTWNLSEDRF